MAAGECCICLASLTDCLAALQCGHVFHQQCTNLLLSTGGSQAKCPLCRQIIRGVLPLFIGENNVTKGESDDVVIFGIPNAAIVAETQMIPVIASESREVINLREEIEALEAENQSLEAELDELIHERDHLEEEFSRKLDETRSTLHSEIRRLGNLCENRSNELQKLLKQKESIESALNLALNKAGILERELEGLREMKLAKETERVLFEMGQLQFNEHIDQIQHKSQADLVTECTILTLHAKRQEQELEKVKEELRMTRVSLEVTERQIRRNKEPPPMIPIKRDTRDMTPLTDLQLDLDFPTINTDGKRPIQPSFKIPPKFSATKLFSTVSDGCGGQKKVFPFPNKI